MDEKQITGTGYCRRRCEQEREIQVQEMKARAKQRIKQLEDRIREEGSGPRFDDVPQSSPEYMKVFDKVFFLTFLTLLDC